ncbi:hypothetical protein B7486_64770, partial [cyanobacterium TDX16]
MRRRLTVGRAAPTLPRPNGGGDSVADHRRTRRPEAQRRRRTAGLGLLAASTAAALLALAGCGSEADDETSDVSTPAGAETATAEETESEAPFEVELLTETYVDESRPTDAGAETPAEPDRTIETRIVHPTSGGPYPLLVL